MDMAAAHLQGNQPSNKLESELAQLLAGDSGPLKTHGGKPRSSSKTDMWPNQKRKMSATAGAHCGRSAERWKTAKAAGKTSLVWS